MYYPRNKSEISFISKLYTRLIYHESDRRTLDYCNYGLPLSGVELAAVRRKRVQNDLVTLTVSGMLEYVQITVSDGGSGDCKEPRLPIDWYCILVTEIVQFVGGPEVFTGGSFSMSKVIDLYEFLLEAELHQYYSELKNDLKASSLSPFIIFVIIILPVLFCLNLCRLL